MTVRHIRVHVRLRYGRMGGIAVAFVEAGIAVLRSVSSLVSQYTVALIADSWLTGNKMRKIKITMHLDF